MLPWVLGFLIPTGFLLVGAVGKKLVSEAPGWIWADWYLGIELALASVSICTLNACDLYRLGERADRLREESLADGAAAPREVKDERDRSYAQMTKEIRQEQGRTIACLALAFFAFLFVGTVHRQWESRPDDQWKKKLMLAGLSNLCGYVPMVCYMLFAKGV
jgi:hypothetical protein